MVLNDAQKKAAEEVIDALTSATTGARSKRKLAEMFLELPDRDAWSEYYEARPIPHFSTRIISLITCLSYFRSSRSLDA